MGLHNVFDPRNARFVIPIIHGGCDKRQGQGNRFRAIAGDASLSAPERLERMVRQHTKVVREHDSLPIMLLAEASASGDPALVDRMRAIFHAYLSLLEGVAREGQTRGEITDEVEPDCLAILLLGAPAALAIRHRLLPDARAEDRFEDMLIPFLRSHIESHEGRTS